MKCLQPLIIPILSSKLRILPRNTKGIKLLPHPSGKHRGSLQRLQEIKILSQIKVGLFRN